MTGPRIGHVRLLASRTAQLRRGVLAASGAGALTILLLLVSERLELGSRNWPWGGLFFAVPLAVAGYFVEVGRFYLYAAIIMLSCWVPSVMGVPGEWTLFAAGVPITASGIVVLARYMRRYPAQPSGVGIDA